MSQKGRCPFSKNEAKYYIALIAEIGLFDKKRHIHFSFEIQKIHLVGVTEFVDTEFVEIGQEIGSAVPGGLGWAADPAPKWDEFNYEVAWPTLVMTRK